MRSPRGHFEYPQSRTDAIPEVTGKEFEEHTAAGNKLLITRPGYETVVGGGTC